MGLAILLALVTAFTPMRDRQDRRTLLAGVWASCPEDGGYGERAFPYVERGKTLWTLHMGPADEFAIFSGDSDDHQDHNTADNMLWPSYHVGGVLNGSRTWQATRAHVTFTATRAGAGEECETFYVQLQQDQAVFAAR